MEQSRILIVEDEWLIADELQANLEDAGYAVAGIASSGKDAIALAAEQQPDLVLMDIVIKGESDGIETAVLMREQFNIPVIYLTAYVDKKTIQRARETGASSYVVKPAGIHQLVPMIEIVLSKAQVERNRDKLLQELQTAQEHIKILQGTLPICASCKKIRDDGGYWQQVETYIREHSEADFTHGICPDCLVKLYPEIYTHEREVDDVF